MKNSSLIKVVTGKVRFNYVNIFRPKAIKEGEEKRYSMTILIPKDSRETILKINEAMEEAKKQYKDKFNDQEIDFNCSDFKTPIKDGDDTENIHYKNHYYINVTSKYKPQILDKELCLIKDESEVYSGCYGRASIIFYPYSFGKNKGVGCGLNNVQKLEDGAEIGAVEEAISEFGDAFKNETVEEEFSWD